MNRWSRSRLDELARITKGKVLSASDEKTESTVRYLGASDLEGKHSGCYAPIRNAVLCNQDDLLMLWDGERSGLVGHGLSGAVGSTVARIRPLSERVAGKYLYHHLRSRYAEIQSLRTGTGVPHVPRDLPDIIEVPVPPLGEQQRIAEILDTIDETIQATERVIAKHKRIRPGLASDLLEAKSANESLNSMGSSEAPSSRASSLTLRARVGDLVFLRDCGRWLSGGTPDTGNLNYWDGEIPWITASSLKGRYLSASQRRLTLAGAEAGSRVVPGGTILFVVRGMSLKKEFRVGMAVRPVAFGQDCKALVPADGIDPKYLLFALEAAENRVLRMVDEASHGTGRLQTSLLGGLKVRIPPFEKQRRVIEILDAIDDTIRSNSAQLQKLRRVRFGLANDLLSGRVRTVAA